MRKQLVSGAAFALGLWVGWLFGVGRAYPSASQGATGVKPVPDLPPLSGWIRDFKDWQTNGYPSRSAGPWPQGEPGPIWEETVYPLVGAAPVPTPSPPVGGGAVNEDEWDPAQYVADPFDLPMPPLLPVGATRSELRRAYPVIYAQGSGVAEANLTLPGPGWSPPQTTIEDKAVPRWTDVGWTETGSMTE